MWALGYSLLAKVGTSLELRDRVHGILCDSAAVVAARRVEHRTTFVTITKLGRICWAPHTAACACHVQCATLACLLLLSPLLPKQTTECRTDTAIRYRVQSHPHDLHNRPCERSQQFQPVLRAECSGCRVYCTCQARKQCHFPVVWSPWWKR